jgi:hypothetical protein
MRHIGDDERRARLARRHGLAPGHHAGGPEAACRAMTVLHATEAPTVHLAVWARTRDGSTADVDAALYTRRTLVKQLAMRRTLFVFPRDLLAAAWGSVSARVAAQERARLLKDLVVHGVTTEPEKWLDAARDALLDRLRSGEELPAAQLREELPELSGRMLLSAGKKYEAAVYVAPRVLGLFAAEGLVVRATNAGHWRSNRPTWTSMAAWLGTDEPPWKSEEGHAELVRRWLWTFGPGTESDLAWWLGATKGVVRRALADLAAVQVSLDSGAIGWVLGDDVEPVPAVEPWGALLPVLDPTTMGWKERGFYLSPEHRRRLFDVNGNAGTTAWWDGRVVGCWVQDADGVVRTVLCEDIGAEGEAALSERAEQLTRWLQGQRVPTVYPSPLMRENT